MLSPTLKKPNKQTHTHTTQKKSLFHYTKSKAKQQNPQPFNEVFGYIPLLPPAAESLGRQHDPKGTHPTFIPKDTPRTGNT